MERGCSLADKLACVCLLLSLSSGPQPREIRLVARNMTFYADGSAEPNPVVRVRAGETVRIVLRNADTGMRHDFTIPDWGIATPVLAGRGEATVEFRAPDRGSAQYNCTPHASMMKGTITVE